MSETEAASTAMVKNLIAGGAKIVTLKGGKQIFVRELDAVEQLDLYEACGALSSNSAWTQSAMILCAVRAIDGIPVPFPIDKQTIKSVAARIGTEGMNAAAKALFGAADEQAASAGADEVLETAKN